LTITDRGVFSACARLPLDDFFVCLDECVGFARERPDLLRKIAGEALGPAGADGGKAVGDAAQRRKAKTNLEHGGEQQHRGEHAECNNERLLE
jgi:hypothetical protein